MNKIKKIMRTLGKGVWFLIPLGIIFGAIASLPAALHLFGEGGLIFASGFWLCTLLLAMIYGIGRDVEADEKSAARKKDAKKASLILDEKAWQQACDHWDEVIQLAGFESIKTAYINGFYSGYKTRAREDSNDD